MLSSSAAAPSPRTRAPPQPTGYVPNQATITSSNKARSTFRAPSPRAQVQQGRPSSATSGHNTSGNNTTTASSFNRSGQATGTRAMSPRGIACDTATWRGQVKGLQGQQQAITTAESTLADVLPRQKSLDEELEAVQRELAVEAQRRIMLEDQVTSLATNHQHLEEDVEMMSLERNAAQDSLIGLRSEVERLVSEQLNPQLIELENEETKLRTLLEHYFPGFAAPKSRAQQQRSPPSMTPGRRGGASPAQSTSPFHQRIQLDDADVEVAVEKQRLDLEVVVTEHTETSDELQQLTEEVIPALLDQLDQQTVEFERQREMNLELQQELEIIQAEVVKSEEEQRGLSDWNEEVVHRMMSEHLGDLRALADRLEA